jgi:hypothetical protein
MQDTSWKVNIPFKRKSKMPCELQSVPSFKAVSFPATNATNMPTGSRETGKAF